MKKKLLTALACLMLAAALLAGCAETEKPAETDEQNEQSEQVEQIENEEEIQDETESTFIYEPTTVSDPDAPSFDDIYNANQLENILSLYGAAKYVTSYNGEDPEESDGEYITANGIFKEISLPKLTPIPDKAHDFTCFDDIWNYFFGDYSEPEPDGYAFYNGNSYYVSDGTDIYALIGLESSYSTEDYYEPDANFYGWSEEDVESITKTETGWQIKFNPDEEDARFFRDEEYQVGDLFVVYEYVDENLILDYYTQVLECADGTVRVLNKTTLVKDGLPEIANEMMKHANPSEEDKGVAVVYLDNGMGYVEPKWINITKGDRVETMTEGYLVYSDREYTSTEFDPNSDNKVFYAVSPLSLFMSPAEFLSVPNVCGYIVTAYDKDGKNVAKNMILDSGWYMSWFYGDFNDESIAYIECSLYNGDSEQIGETLRIDK